MPVTFLRALPPPCGSELARDSGGSACINAGCVAAIASKLAPTFNRRKPQDQAGCGTIPATF
ncbi:hypothetical protein CD58_24165 [Pseudomonas brassicacearum]|nr:hypothetical protein CD58_24165 [Pseudomonas brassicacearum]